MGAGNNVKIRIKPMEPLAEGEEVSKNVTREDHFEFIDNIKGGVIPSEFIPAVVKGIREAMERGIVAGYKMEDISVELNDGSYHDVDSSEVAFKLAGSHAFQDAAQKAGPVLLEPIMKVEVRTPEEFMGDVNGNISSKRGHVEGMDEVGGRRVITAHVPLAEMFGYTDTLRSMTQGRAVMVMEFDHYAVVPQNIAEEIKTARSS